MNTDPKKPSPQEADFIALALAPLREVLEASSGPYYVSGNETQRARAAYQAAWLLAKTCQRNGLVLMGSAPQPPVPEPSLPS